MYEQQQFTAYRIEYENVCEERQVTTYKPVWETAVHENRYTVARPVMETSEREETYTVQRPVYETAEREEAYTVMRPVYETAYRTECHTVLQPVTTYRTQYVDQGCFYGADGVEARPGRSRGWRGNRARCAVDPVTGQTVYQRAGLYWVQTPRGQYEVQKVWHPNVVAQQVQQTSYVPQTVTQQVPVQVCKYVPEQVVRKVPVQVCRMVTEQQVRKVPVTTCKMVYEERVEQVPYQVCRMVAQQQTIRVPHSVEKRIPVTYTCNVPRLVCYRVPLDACGEPIAEPPVAEPPPTSCPAPAAPQTTLQQQPTPAPQQQPQPQQEPSGANVKPELGPGALHRCRFRRKKAVREGTGPAEARSARQEPARRRKSIRRRIRNWAASPKHQLKPSRTLAWLYTPAMLADAGRAGGRDPPLASAGIDRAGPRGAAAAVLRFPGGGHRPAAGRAAGGGGFAAGDREQARGLARYLPGVDRPLAQLSVIVHGKEILLRQGDGLIEPGGQLRFDFDA